MKISDVKRCIGKPVRFSSPRNHIKDGEYVLTGCILRKNDKGQFYYLAELTDPKQRKCMLTVRLDEVEVIVRRNE